MLTLVGDQVGRQRFTLTLELSARSKIAGDQRQSTDEESGRCASVSVKRECKVRVAFAGSVSVALIVLPSTGIYLYGVFR